MHPFCLLSILSNPIKNVFIDNEKLIEINYFLGSLDTCVEFVITWSRPIMFHVLVFLNKVGRYASLMCISVYQV